MWSRLEIPCKVTLVFDVLKGKAIDWPRIISKEAIMVVGSTRPMEDAARIAYTELALGWKKSLVLPVGKHMSC